MISASGLCNLTLLGSDKRILGIHYRVLRLSVCLQTYCKLHRLRSRVSLSTIFEEP